MLDAAVLLCLVIVAWLNFDALRGIYKRLHPWRGAKPK
jgi:hypothetical protein